MPRSTWIAAIVAVGCSKSSAPAIDVTAINALVPEPHRPTLAFEARTVEEPGKHGLRYTIPVPKGWRVDKVHVAEFHAPSALGAGTRIDVTSTCLPTGVDLFTQVPCGAADWEAIVDKKIETDFLEVLHVEKGPHRRTVFATGGAMNPDARTVTVMWWLPGGVEHFTCYARLESPAVIESANAFAKACESVVVTRL